MKPSKVLSQRSMTSFLNISTATKHESETDVTNAAAATASLATVSVSTSIPMTNPSSVIDDDISLSRSQDNETSDTTHSTFGEFDVGYLFCNNQASQTSIAALTDEQKRRLLTEHWMPPTDYQWPFHQNTKQKKYLRLNHISGPRYGYFKLSQALNGVVCVPCVIFGSECATNNHGKRTALGRLVQTPLRRYSHLTGKDSDLDDHLNNQYHKTAQTFADQFLIQLKAGDIATNLDKIRKQKAAENRERLVPIVKTIILCGRCGIAYRGRRDDGTLDVDKPIAVGQ